MSINFDNLVNSFLETEVGISDDFITEILANQLRENLLALHLKQKLKTAGIGNNSKLTEDKLIRNDKVYWLDRKHNDVHENSFFDLMDNFVRYLNRTCYAGINGYEFHYALYEPGSFYKRHLDQFKDNSSRAYSMIIYLNLDWEPNHGGELCIFHPNHFQLISPNSRKCVFFKSGEKEHEVQLSHESRMSITGWLKSD